MSVESKLDKQLNNEKSNTKKFSGTYQWIARYRSNPTENVVFWFTFSRWVRVSLACCFFLYFLPAAWRQIQETFSNPNLSQLAFLPVQLSLLFGTISGIAFITTFVLTEAIQIFNRYFHSIISPAAAGLAATLLFPLPAILVAYNQLNAASPPPNHYTHLTTVFLIQTATYAAAILSTWWLLAEKSLHVYRIKLSTFLKLVIPLSLMLLFSSINQVTMFFTIEIALSCFFAYVTAYTVDYLFWLKNQ